MYPYIRFWFHEIGHIRDANVNASAGDYSGTHASIPDTKYTVPLTARQHPTHGLLTITRTTISVMHTPRLVRTSLLPALTDSPEAERNTKIARYLDNAENFAQEVVVAAYDKIVPGGIAGLVPNYEDIYNQFVNVQEVMGDELCPGGACDRLFEDEYGTR
jgi:hypothetical protein